MSIKDLSKYIVEEYLIDEIERSSMPQIKGNDIPKALNSLKKYGIPYRYKVVQTNDLHPIQTNAIQSKIDNITKKLLRGHDFNPIFISSDWYIIDGHHRWLANKQIGNKKIKVIMIGYPKNSALKLFNKLDNKLNEEMSNITKTVVVLSGRFQPFHKGHYYSYNNLINKFGKNNVYIATSNIHGDKRSPFNFKEKKNIMTKLFGIPANKIVLVKNPYKPEEILKDFDPKTTAFVVALGKKDADRLGGKYYIKYKGKVNKSYLNRGYVYIVPQLQLTIQGKIISGSEIRQHFSKKLFKNLFSKYDDKLFNLMNNKLNENKFNKNNIELDQLILDIRNYNNQLNNKILLLCGGSYGHIDHPFEDMDLTFGDLKIIISLALEGKLELVQEKCIDGNSVINLKKNGNKTIKEIVENKIEDKVYSYNIEKNEYGYEDIIDYANNGQTNEWLEIELENGNKIKITPNHRIYVKDVGYIQAKDLTDDMNLIIE